MERIKLRGTNLIQANIHFDLTQIVTEAEFEKAVSFLTGWEDKIIGMDLSVVTPKLLTLDLPNLEKLKLGLNNVAAVDMLKRHFGSLKELTIDQGYGDLWTTSTKTLTSEIE